MYKSHDTPAIFTVCLVDYMTLVACTTHLCENMPAFHLNTRKKNPTDLQLKH